MKKFVALFALVALVALTSGAPTLDNGQKVELEDENLSSGYFRETLVRERRFTCDGKSDMTSNNSLCDSKCIFKGRKGGRCEGTRCVCQTDKWIPF